MKLPDPVQLTRTKTMEDRLKKLWKVIWCHRAAYLALGMAYGAKCWGLIDADLLAQIVTALYCAMFSQKH